MKQIQTIFIVMFSLVSASTHPLQKWIWKVPQKITKRGKYQLRTSARQKSKKILPSKKRYMSTSQAKKTEQKIIKQIQKIEGTSLYEIIKNTLFSYAHSIKQYFYPQQKEVMQPTQTTSLIPDDPTFKKNITLIIDLLKPKEEVANRVAQELSRYKHNTIWQNINIIFVIGKNETHFEINRTPHSHSFENIPEIFKKFLLENHENLIEYIAKIQAQPFSHLEYLDIQRSLNVITSTMKLQSF